MNVQPKISIITACYNSEKTIEQTIQSVLNQTYENIEYIIIDGASTDGTMEIVNKYRNQIDVVVSEKDKGIYDAFNKGLGKATGQYIQFLNSDDFLNGNLIIEKIAQFIVENEYPIAVYGDIYFYNERSGYLRKHGHAFTQIDLKRGHMPPHPAFFVSNKAFELIGKFDEAYKIAGDFDFTFRLFDYYKDEIKYISEVVTVFRLGGISSDIQNIELTTNETVSALKSNGIHLNGSDIYTINSSDYLRKWLEIILFDEKSIFESLKEQNVKNVVLFGSGEIALLLATELEKNNINILCFVDNDSDRWGIRMNQQIINSPQWIKENINQIDKIILSFEGNYEKEVMYQIFSMSGIDQDLVISWKWLL